MTAAIDPFADLNALLGEATKVARDRKAAQDAKARLLKGGATAAQVEEDAALLRAWEEQHEWRIEANVALFVEQECTGCGDFQYLFQGLFGRQEARVKGGGRRWEPQGEVNAKLPNEVMLQYRPVPMCGECAERHGFTFARSYYEYQDPVGQLAACDAVLAEAREETAAPAVPEGFEAKWPWEDEVEA